MPLTTLAAQVTAAGISAPTYDEIKQSLEESFQAIYGSDIYIAPDSQDGQLIAVFAQAIYDCNQQMLAVYNSFRPTYARDAGLSSIVKINGIRRKSASFSTAVGTVGGVTGTLITSGVVQDNNGNKWNLPASVTIPLAGVISVTVTAQNAGAIAAPAGTIHKIATPTFGWQTFVSTSDSVAGQPIESDAALRKRQTVAAGLPNITPLSGVVAALAALPGVTRVRVYENSSNSPDVDGIPARNISVVIEGGDILQVATTIGQKKTPGSGTYGSTSQVYTDPVTSISYTINFYVLAEQSVTVELSVQPGVGWNSTIGVAIQNAVSAYVNGLGIGADVQISRLWAPAYLNGGADAQKYEITVLTLNGAGIDVPIAFNKAPSCDPSNVVVTVLP